MYDVIVIGAGVIGCAVARELSKYHLDVCVLEQESDVCEGTSKANSGLVHAGFDCEVGSLKAEMNVRGNELMEPLCEMLDIPFIRNGALVIATNEEEKKLVAKLYKKGQANHVPELFILNREDVMQMEPAITKNVTGALFAKTAGIVCPFELTLALAENAYENGVEFKFDCQVRKIEKREGDVSSFYHVETVNRKKSTKEDSKKNIELEYLESRMIINCAGVYSDEIHNMVSENFYHITSRRGEYCLLDKGTGNHVTRTIFKVPGPLGKGILVTPTVDGNLLLGPTAENIRDKNGVNTSFQGLHEVMEKTGMTVEGIPMNKVITSFAGLRAVEDSGDFIIEEAFGAAGFIDAVGIASPGLTSAPAIGERIGELVERYLRPEKKTTFISRRKGITRVRECNHEERQALIKENPEYANIICRCEMISEGEIRAAIRRPLGAKSLDGIKRRTRAGAGRCQSGFCAPKVMDILAEELHMEPVQIRKSGTNSQILAGKLKEDCL